ncbi:hypothetical protein GSF04_10385 [Pseudoalteromonas sp. A22]|uniref:hypothetical protein n=1 Tax=Pseudoalteromonas TaxID=53246 RepID=UPI001BA9ADCB|nr:MULTISPECIES: hypothetical protein [Pseudoalteromonas]QUI62888.1 hypothetical protein GSF04_10385 [Pseudoalteromonas sp. A22]USE68547.1 hypothetical protein CTT31_05225 [Pseudoalteromonas flavipulchra]
MNAVKRFIQHNKYWLNALLLVLPAWFYYQSLHPEFPAPLAEQTLGKYSITPMPFDDKPPYIHDNLYVKDFLLLFNKGDVDSMRQGYLNIGPNAMPLAQLMEHELGILHGTKHGQHVHALAKKTLSKDDRVWLTIETWQGEVIVMNWPLPEYLIKESA